MTSDTTSPADTQGTRNVTLADLAAMLRDQQARNADIVAPATAIRAAGGQLVIDGTDPVLGTDGVTMTAGTYVPTEVCDQGLAGKLGIPAQYLRRMRFERPELYDANVNGWPATPAGSSSAACARRRGAGRGRRGRSCPTGTSGSTTSTSCSPRWTASAPPASRLR